jgi:hypothetical protein
VVAALPPEPSQLLSYQTPLCCWVKVIWLGRQTIIFALLFPIPGNLPGISLDLMRSLIVVAHQGGCFMTSLSFIECCHLLAVDPKTLRQWLAQAQMSLHAHPTDARIKCLTSEQIFVLAHLHDRVLQTSVPAALARPMPSETESQKPLPAAPDGDLNTRVAHMETQIATLQAQLTDLTLQLLREREQRTEQRLLALEAQLSSTREHLSPRSALSMPTEPATPSLARHAPRQRTRLIPLIEYGARGQYVLICPREGEQHILPDSPEWFAWLATFNSFRFIGRQGRLSASRTKGRSCWMAYRRIHGHCYAYGLGNTKRLTIAHLEQMAATLQAHVPTL